MSIPQSTGNTSGAAAVRPWHTVHPASPRDRDTMRQVRAMVEPNKGKLQGVAARPVFEGIIRSVLAPEGVTYREDRVGDVSGWWCGPAGAPEDKAILHLHGGWFNWGSAEAFQHLVGHIARSAGIKAFIPDYGLAPENVFPHAINDARACLLGLWERGVRSVAVTGDSAGGNLALALLSLFPHEKSIVGAVAFSPVTDLTQSGESWESRAATDPFFVRDQAKSLIDAYLGGTDPADPIASPLFGTFAGLPPIRVHAGNDEVLLSDAMRYVERAVAMGTDASVDVWEGMVHGFLGNVGRLDAADRVLTAIGTFLRHRFAAD